MEKRKEEAGELGGFLVDERDLLLFVDEESFLHFSSKTLFFLLEVEGLESPFEMAKSLQKMGQMMEKAWGYTSGHERHGGEAHQARGRELQMGGFPLLLQKNHFMAEILIYPKEVLEGLEILAMI